MSRNSQSADRVKIDRDQREFKRWDIVAFSLPKKTAGESNKIGVKRIAVLPGESLEIRGGDLWVDGSRLVKSVELQREIRIPVFDSAFVPKSLIHVGTALEPAPNSTGWQKRNGRWMFAKSSSSDAKDAKLQYQNWRRCRSQHARNRPFHFEDYYAFNQNMPRSLNESDQVFYRFSFAANENTSLLLTLALSTTFMIEIQPTRWEINSTGGRSIDSGVSQADLKKREWATGVWDRPTTNEFVVEVTTFDGRFELLLDGESVFQAEIPSHGLRPESILPYVEITPVALDIAAPTECHLERMQIWRDIFYFDAGDSRFSSDQRPGLSPGDQEGTRQSFPATGVDEYFLLGDNVPISLDSRNWSNPAIKSRDIFGIVKPGN